MYSQHAVGRGYSEGCYEAKSGDAIMRSWICQCAHLTWAFGDPTCLHAPAQRNQHRHRHKQELRLKDETYACDMSCLQSRLTSVEQQASVGSSFVCAQLCALPCMLPMTAHSKPGACACLRVPPRTSVRIINSSRYLIYFGSE